MRIPLGKFACICLEARFDGDLAGAVEEALRDYAGRIEVDCDGLLPVPRFGLEGIERKEEIELEVSIASRPRRILEGEARRQGVAFEQLAAHAIFVYTTDSEVPQRLDLAQSLAAASWDRAPRSQQATREVAAAPWRLRR
jgi:hypothetical protein